MPFRSWMYEAVWGPLWWGVKTKYMLYSNIGSLFTWTCQIYIYTSLLTSAKLIEDARFNHGSLPKCLNTLSVCSYLMHQSARLRLKLCNNNQLGYRQLTSDQSRWHYNLLPLCPTSLLSTKISCTEGSTTHSCRRVRVLSECLKCDWKHCLSYLLEPVPKRPKNW